MFKKLVGLSLLSVALFSGCNEAPMTTDDLEMELGQSEDAMCANSDGVNAALAALAAATAKQLGRWQPTTDFAPMNGAPWHTQLTAAGKARCSDGKCWNVQAILDLQKAPPNSVKFGGVVFNANNFISQLTSKWNEQKNCELRGGTGAANCSAEQHKLTFKSQVAGACDTIYTYDAKNTSGGNLASPAQLKNKLLFVGGTGNPFIAFSSTGTTVSIDPTFGLTEDSTTTSGACTAACTKISTSNVAGQCCSCNGASKKYVKAAWSTTTYLCQ